MKPSDIVKALHLLLDIQQPVFLWGPPGVGKSQVVAEVARARGMELCDVRAVLLDPVDLRGLPRVTEKGLAQWCPPAFLPPEGSLGRGVVFLDELNAATPLVLVPTSFNSVREEEWKAMGANIIIYANQLTRTGFPAMREAAETILRCRRAQECDEKCMSIQEIITLIPEE